jgi:hypothetical protein
MPFWGNIDFIGNANATPTLYERLVGIITARLTNRGR